MFFGRERELKRLNDMYQSEKLEMAIIYGRRRIGKTTLINEFCRGKPTIFFAALENTAQVNLEALSDAVLSAERKSTAVFRSFQDALNELAQLSVAQRLVFVIDEYPYLAKAEPGFSSLLQHYLDHQFKGTKLFLILCGSSMSFMEKQVLGYQSPLYGRRTGQFKLQHFDYRETGQWFPEYSPEDKAIMYGVTGGIPFYLEQFAPDRSVKENLLYALLNPNAVLFEEPSVLLKEELREPAVYNAVVTAVASGKTKLSEIATTVGMETGLCSKYIHNLITLGILRKETPVTDPKSRRPIYVVDDLFFRFWYTFVQKNMAAIVSGRIADYYDSTIGRHLSDYMGLVFEQMCREYLLYYDRQLPFLLQDVGQWWGGNPNTRKQAQIDLVATSADGQSAIVGSCKFRNEPVPIRELSILQEYAQAMGSFSHLYYYLFGKKEFAQTLLDRKEEQNLRLISLDELYRPQ